MSLVVRPMRDEEARSFLAIQRAAVRGLAAKDYPASVIDTWAPLPVTDTAIAFFRVNHDNEIRLIAELDGALVGIGALVLAESELRACYVVPALRVAVLALPSWRRSNEQPDITGCHTSSSSRRSRRNLSIGRLATKSRTVSSTRSAQVVACPQ